jgi:hypothetical protein
MPVNVPLTSRHPPGRRSSMIPSPPALSSPNSGAVYALPMKRDPIIGNCKFADGAMRPIYDDGQRQYVFDDDGYPVYGVWLIPQNEPDLPVIVEAAESRNHKEE